MLLIRKRSSKVKNSQNMAIALVFRVTGEMQEIDILKSGRYGMEAGARRGGCEDANFVLSAGEVRADHLELGFQGGKLVVGGHDSGPNLSFESGQGLRRYALQE